MKKILLTTICLLFCFIQQSCSDHDTYADMRKRENRQIQNFLQNGISESQAKKYMISVPTPIKVITENEFFANDTTTNIERNEYVLFKNTGVYMQIVRKGTGQKLREGETTTLLSRYYEYNIATDSINTTNRFSGTEAHPEVMTVSNQFGNISGTFLRGIMQATYKTTVVPSGWLIPLKYVRIGRQHSPESEIALVRLIVPSTQGQDRAQQLTYACFYEISYQRAR